MDGFLKLMVISACLLLAILIFVTSSKTYKEDKSATIAWFIADAYAIGLIYTAIKILIGA
ncbi:hypothetical protein ACVRZG_02735 [Streptococcus hyovaginalis]|uniref:hypothetical protein n=1 Tax=Streptococcus hyovaginalis TaxID=149015 RepID=UPI00041235CD|nr:hypothetical protein [Streptococcus hyovaginalis]QBX25444.1 hypothetical protein Javan258_0037 [Streptococcus phage Javan258]